MTHDFPTFRPRAPWWGADLQTLRNALVERATTPSAKEERGIRLPLADGTGDELVASLALPFAPDPFERPLVVLIHGLSGCEESAYMVRSANHWLDRGHAVVRLNLRGAGPSRATCRLQYHAGRSEDLKGALEALDPEWVAAGIVLMGYSLGGNMLLKFLAESGRAFPIRCGIAVSAPIDLSSASQRILAPRNRLYQRRLLATMKLECFGGAAEITSDERAHVLAARNIYEFDEHFVAPRNGFRDAEHYYRECHARRYLADIDCPTLIVYALDDPWIPSHSYTSYPWRQNPNLVPILAPGGGHVGFHDRGSNLAYHDRCAGLFWDRLSA